jgi:hypothetical protein
VGKRTIRTRKLQPSLSPPTIPSFIIGDNGSNNIIQISSCSVEEYSNEHPLSLTCHNDNKSLDRI